MSKYPNIDIFYEENQILLESDDYRLCKSIPRNIAAYVDKFADYYRIHKGSGESCQMSEDTITYEVLDLNKWSDVVTTAKRIMREFNFLKEDGEKEYITTPEFDYYVTSEIEFDTFLIEKMENIHSINEMTMLYNSIICTLREGYLYNKILVFPDSYEKFARAITNESDRNNFRKRVYELYGFAGRYHDCSRDDYTPNANYRIVTVLNSLGFIEITPSDFDDVRAYSLTSGAHKYLELLNKNLGGITEEKFQELIDAENEFERKLKKLAEQYGIAGTRVVTHETRLPQVQEAFRDRLISKHGQKCMLCGITHKDMLIASHIRRAADEDIYGKADYNNGLLLCANHDKLFDKYLISFNCLDGKIMISDSLYEEELQICGLNEELYLPEELMTDERSEYLMDHNNEFLKKESERE